MEKIEIILTDCIRDIKSGKASLPECLNRYPSQRKELEPLLKMALNIEEPPALRMDINSKQASRARLMRQIRDSKQQKSRSFTDIFSFGLPPRLVWARVAVSVVAVLFVLSILTGTTAYASQSSVPGDLLYPVKSETENVRLLLAGNNADKAELNLGFAKVRLVEMSKVADEKNAAAAAAGYRRNLNAAVQQILGISDEASLIELLESTAAELQRQMVYCDNLMDAVPVYIVQAKEASTLAVSEQLELIETLAQRNMVQAAQINLGAMQNRLQRAQNKSSTGQFQTMQDVLLQYQQFNRLGEQILQDAQLTNDQKTEIEEMILQASTGYLDILSGLSQEVPAEYQNSIVTSQQVTLQLQTQARFGYQKGNPGASSGTPGNSTGQSNQTGPQYQGDSGNTDSETVVPATTFSPDTGGNSGSGTVSGSGESTSSSEGSGAGAATTTTSSGSVGNANSGGMDTGSVTDAGGGSGSGTTSAGGNNSSLNSQKP